VFITAVRAALGVWLLVSCFGPTTQPDDTANGSWTAVGDWSGEGSRALPDHDIAEFHHPFFTKDFTVGDQWRIDIEMISSDSRPFAQVFVLTPENAYVDRGMTILYRSGTMSRTFTAGGTFRLMVNAWYGKWKVAVEEMRSTK
jgi:hypothetical protein